MQKIKGVRVTDQQAAIYGLIKRFGRTGLTDHALVGVATHEMRRPYSESGIRTRRAELAHEGLVRPAKTVKTRSGRQATVWVAV